MPAEFIYWLAPLAGKSPLLGKETAITFRGLNGGREQIL